MSQAFLAIVFLNNCKYEIVLKLYDIILSANHLMLDERKITIYIKKYSHIWMLS